MCWELKGQAHSESNEPGLQQAPTQPGAPDYDQSGLRAEPRVARDECLTVGAIDNRVAMTACFDFQNDSLRQVVKVNTICNIGLDRVWIRRLILNGIKHTVPFLLHDAAPTLKWISALAATSLSSIGGCGGASLTPRRNNV